MGDMSMYRDMLKGVLRESRNDRGTNDRRGDGNDNNNNSHHARPLKRRKKNRKKNNNDVSISAESSENDSSHDKFLRDNSSADLHSDQLKIENQSRDLGNKNQAINSISIPEIIEVNSDTTSFPDNGESAFEEIEAESSNKVIDLTSDDSNDSEDEFDSDEFENVDLNSPSPAPENNTKDGDIVVSIGKPVYEDDKKKKKSKQNQNIIGRDEKIFRKNFHIWCLACQLLHGVLRNQWCNSHSLMEYLKETLPTSLISKFVPVIKLKESDNIPYREKQIGSRRFLDALKDLMIFYNHDFKITRDVGIYKKKWDEISELAMSDTSLTSNTKSTSFEFKKFLYSILKKKGSRDIAAQGFVALLRSIGLNARLIFSLQPPDFTDNIKVEVSSLREKSSSSSVEDQFQTSRRSKAGNIIRGLKPGERLLAQFRNRRRYNTNESVLPLESSQHIDKESDYPIFWAEVWDPFASKWISIDPVVFQYMEVVKIDSKFEPRSTDERNNSYYVIAFDNQGGVRDVTRRYSKNFNAKIRRKRITRESNGNLWYSKLICTACSKNRLYENSIDKIENEYFLKRSYQEGMPNSIQDFKNHPIYVLESQLKSNEVIMPKVPCGRTRKKNSKTSETIPVYKRENVHIVRSAKSWYMHGRVLKTGERPILIRELKKDKNSRYDDDLFGEDDDANKSDIEDTDIRLYAVDQTEPYIAPPVVDGEVPKNAYGNIDLYTSSMLPPGGIYRDSRFSLKAAIELKIDYAEAVVGFDFKNSSSTPRKKGVVVAKEYEEAMVEVEKYFREKEEEQLKLRIKVNSLRKWKLFLTRLQIMENLNEKYGKVKDDDAEKDKDRGTQESDEIYRDTDDGIEMDSNYGSEGGGFLPSPENLDDGGKSDDSEFAGGFLQGENTSEEEETNYAMPGNDSIIDDNSFRSNESSDFISEKRDNHQKNQDANYSLKEFPENSHEVSTKTSSGILDDLRNYDLKNDHFHILNKIPHEKTNKNYVSEHSPSKINNTAYERRDSNRRTTAESSRKSDIRESDTRESDIRQSDVESIDSLEEANKNISEDEEQKDADPANDEEFEFEYSDSDDYS